MIYETKEEAARAWVGTFNAIPTSLVQEASDQDIFELSEVTQPCVGDRVRIYAGEHKDNSGEIVQYRGGDFIVRPDGETNGVQVSRTCLYIEHDGILPMWGTMWAFKDPIDNMWLDGMFDDDAVKKMSKCGFRVYKEANYYQYLFGIDGAGYDFYDYHWVPLYEARGLYWHKP